MFVDDKERSRMPVVLGSIAVCPEPKAMRHVASSVGKKEIEVYISKCE